LKRVGKVDIPLFVEGHPVGSGLLARNAGEDGRRAGHGIDLEHLLATVVNNQQVARALLKADIA
jgi:hypothetical protein